MNVTTHVINRIITSDCTVGLSVCECITSRSIY